MPDQMRGVASPNGAQARVYRLMSPAERDELHQRFFAHQSDGHCPMEAAWSAHDDDRTLLIAVTMFTAIFVVAVVVYLLFPHATVFAPLLNQDVSVRSQVVLLTVLFEVIPGVMVLPRLLRERVESHRLARRGPDCDPWAGLEDDERAPLSFSLKNTLPDVMWVLGRDGPLARGRLRPAFSQTDSSERSVQRVAARAPEPPITTTRVAWGAGTSAVSRPSRVEPR